MKIKPGTCRTGETVVWFPQFSFCTPRSFRGSNVNGQLLTAGKSDKAGQMSECNCIQCGLSEVISVLTKCRCYHELWVSFQRKQVQKFKVKMLIYDCEYDVRVVSKRKHNQPCVKLAIFPLPIHISTSYILVHIGSAKHTQEAWVRFDAEERTGYQAPKRDYCLTPHTQIQRAPISHQLMFNSFCKFQLKLH